MKLLLAIVGFLCVILKLTFATNGVDVSTKVSKESWKCIKDQGNKFALVRIAQSNGNVDPNGAETIKNAREAGIEYVDGYIFPCQKCGDPKGQMKKALDNLNKANAKIGQVWIDVEGTQYWSDKKEDNIKFIQELVDQANDQKVTVAMYTSQSQWDPITGNSKKFKDLQLWYPHYDNKANFDDFKPFGGWTKPAIKQYIGTTQVCNVGVDKDWYP